VNWIQIHNSLRPIAKDAIVAAGIPEVGGDGKPRIGYENREIDPPAPNEANRATTGELWAMVYIKPGETEQKDLGPSNRRFRHFGIAFVQIHAPAGWGEDKVLSAATSIQASLNSQTVAGGIVLQEAKVVKVGRWGAWFQVNVTVPFFADDFG